MLCFLVIAPFSILPVSYSSHDQISNGWSIVKSGLNKVDGTKQFNTKKSFLSVCNKLVITNDNLQNSYNSLITENNHS